MSLVKEAPLTTGLERGMREIVDRLARAAMVVAPPVLRIALAVPFFCSDLTRWDGFLSRSPSEAYHVLNLFPPPEPLGNVVVITAVLVVIGILLNIAGMPIGGGRLSAMGAVA
jgi:hypothetical protein